MDLKGLVVLLEALLVSVLDGFNLFLPSFETLKVGFDDWVESDTLV